MRTTKLAKIMSGFTTNALVLLFCVFVAIRFVSGDKYCHDWDNVCNQQVGTGNAIYKLWAQHSNSKEDRIWTFYETSVAFATSTTYSTGYLNEFDQAVSWASSSAYIVGWYSYHSNSAEDRRFNVYYRYIATGYVTKNCYWSNFNGYDGTNDWWEGGSSYYAFGIQSYHDNSKEDRVSRFYWCQLTPPSPPPPPPSPPPPSPPPPSPPPPGSNGVPTVTIGVASSQVTDYEFDFQISVADNDCSDTVDCLGTSAAVTTNMAKGLHCDAYVADTSDASCTYATSGDYLPCMKWDNFYDEDKADAYKFTLRTTNSTSDLVTGNYNIKYTCYWTYADGTIATGTSTGLKTLHNFNVEEGCSNWLSLEHVPLEKAFLLSTPSFLSMTDCDTTSIDYVKETAFRKFDTNPQDGKLEYSELLKAFLTHDIDTSYFTIEIGESGYTNMGELSLSDIMNSDALPFSC